MENYLQSPAARGKKNSLIGRSSSSGLFGTAPKVLKAQQPTQTTTSSQTSTSIAEPMPGSPDSKGTPSRKRNIEASKTDAIRAVLAAPTEQTPDIKKLSSEIAEQKKIIAELTAQKETLEHETQQQVFVRQMLIDSLKSEVAELKEQQHQGSQEHRVALEQTAQNLKKELDEQRGKGEKQTAKILALEAALSHASERMEALEKESAAMRAACDKAEQRELNYGAEIEKLRVVNTDLQARVAGSEARHADTMVAMNEQIDALRRQFFFSTAISIKLGQFYQGRQLNVSLTDLYERLMKLALPFADWPAWISEQLLSAVEVPAPAAAAAANNAAAAKRQRTQAKRV